MAGLLDYLKKYEVVENSAVETFVSALNKQIEALEAGKLTRRSWAKPEGNGYLIKLGKLEKTYSLPNKQEALDFLGLIASEVRTDADFKAIVEAAYGEPLGEEPVKRRGRKPRTAAATVDTDVLRIPLRPRT